MLLMMEMAMAMTVTFDRKDESSAEIRPAAKMSRRSLLPVTRRMKLPTS